MRPNGIASSRWLRSTLSVEAGGSRSSLAPLFTLTTAGASLGNSLPSTLLARQGKRPSAWHYRKFYTTPATAIASAGAPIGVASHDSLDLGVLPVKALPLQCPGCGAFSQTSNPSEPGFYDLSRHSTKKYLGLAEETKRIRPDDQVVRDVLQHIDREKLAQLGVDLGGLWPEHGEEDAQPAQAGVGIEAAEAPLLCVRCHDLVHHNRGSSIYHPGVDSIRETIAESPYKYNHIYHVIDAADFPMSVLPRIHDLLDLMPLRSKNRRSRREKFYRDRHMEMSFIITRADLLAPRKEQVDRLMPWIRTTLRDALGRTARNARLGNVRCVSAKRGWWTKELREEIWQRGGATWMVGKANVGKSYLFQHVFPKGRMDWAASKSGTPGVAGTVEQTSTAAKFDDRLEESSSRLDEQLSEDENVLLPPATPETNYPPMPVVSALPGTTASPIRLPFGNGKGELIDMPGLSRSNLSDYVDAAHHDTLVMKSRIQPEQTVLKGPWHSLLLGGLIRITPRTPDLVFLAYNFTPLKEHRTLTEKAVGIQEQTSELKVENIAAPGTGEKIKLAGSYELKYDVTRERAGPITRRDAANIKVDRLPYRVLAIDILIEGCGWVEVVAQVRTRKLFNERQNNAGSAEDADDADRRILEALNPSALRPEGKRAPDGQKTAESADSAEAPNWPVIDVYSPGGRFVGSRPPLNAWLMCRPKRSAAAARSRPRRSMKGAKKRAKAMARSLQAAD